MIMQMTYVYNSFLLCLVITFNIMTPLKAFAIEPKESPINPEDYFNQDLTQINDMSTEDENKSDDILMRNILRILLNLQEPNSAVPVPLEKKQPSADPKNEFPVNRRFAMGTFNNELFGKYDREVTKLMKNKLFGKVNVKEDECMSHLIKNYVKNFEDLLWAQKFCRE